jgi:hypothetical protein
VASVTESVTGTTAEIAKEVGVAHSTVFQARKAPEMDTVFEKKHRNHSHRENPRQNKAHRG